MVAESTTFYNDTRTIRATDLTDKERRVLTMLVLDYGIDEMAHDLFISRTYVYLLIRQLRARFLVKTNIALVVRALASGLIAPDGTFLK